jgi:Icc protein
MGTQATWRRRQFLKTGAGAGLGAAAMGMPPLNWAAAGAPNRTLRILFYTDVHTRVEWDTPLALEQAAARMNQEKADLVIAGGDLITDGFQSSAASVAHRWDAYMHMHRAIDTEIHPAIGNHDLVAARPEDGTEPSADPRRIFRDKMGLEKTYRSFDAAGTHILFLDGIHVTDNEDKYHGFIEPEQMAWLEADLSGVAKDTPVILVTHMPLLTAFYQATRGATEPAPPNRVMTNGREVLKRFRAHNLLLVLQGHLHVDELLRWRNTTLITGGAVCAKWWRGNWHGTEEGFGLVTLTPDRVTWQYIDYGWTAKRP